MTELNAYVCKWCGATATTHMYITDLTAYPREYQEHFCDRCYDHENEVYTRLEFKYGEVETAHLARLMRQWLRREKKKANQS